MRSSSKLVPLVVGSTVFASCAVEPPADEHPAEARSAITSAAAQILDFDFEADVVAARGADARNAALSQLMYTQGQLTTGHKANGQVGNVAISDVSRTPAGEKERIHYRASMPVAWPHDSGTPGSLELVLPLDVTNTGEFNAKYDGRCGKHDFDTSTFWHDWNPTADGCSIDEGDVVRSRVSIGPSARATSNEYPEYDLVWNDGKLDVVAVFAIISSNDHGDWGYTGAKSFADNATRQLYGAKVEQKGATSTVLEHRRVTGRASAGDVQVDVLVIDKEVGNVGGDFDALYDDLSERADLILYNGHAGLGQNINAFARKGRVAAGKYQLMLLNGCQTFAYIDTTLTDRRRDANGGSDPHGTKYLDVIANALPGYASNLANMSSQLFNAIVHAERPTSYRDIIGKMPSSHVVVVFGEEDNRFSP